MQILPLSAFSEPQINQQEYILGLVDFTGEVGRYAVACATSRKVDGVELCHAVCDVLQAELMLLGMSGKVGRNII